MDADRLERMIADGDAPLVVDVRSRFEYVSGHLPGAVHFPFWRFFASQDDLKPGAASGIVLYCEHGPRAMLAKHLLRVRGHVLAVCLDGHMHRWRREGRPIEE